MNIVIEISRDSRGTYWVHRRGGPSYAALDHAAAHERAKALSLELGGEQNVEIVDRVKGR